MVSGPVAPGSARRRSPANLAATARVLRVRRMEHPSPPRTWIPWRHQRVVSDFGHCRVPDQPAPGWQSGDGTPRTCRGMSCCRSWSPLSPGSRQGGQAPPQSRVRQTLPCPDGSHLGKSADLVRLGGRDCVMMGTEPPGTRGATRSRQPGQGLRNDETRGTRPQPRSLGRAES